MPDQDFLFDVKTDKVSKGGYIKLLKQIIGDAFTSCNKKPMTFHCALVDTEDDRALGICFSVACFWPKWVIKKIEQYGCVVLNSKRNMMIGSMNGARLRSDNLKRATPMQHHSITIRILEDEDFA